MLRIIVMAVVFTVIIIAMFSILERGDVTRRDDTTLLNANQKQSLKKAMKPETLEKAVR